VNFRDEATQLLRSGIRASGIGHRV